MVYKFKILSNKKKKKYQNISEAGVTYEDARVVKAVLFTHSTATKYKLQIAARISCLQSRVAPAMSWQLSESRPSVTDCPLFFQEFLKEENK